MITFTDVHSGAGIFGQSGSFTSFDYRFKVDLAFLGNLNEVFGCQVRVD